MNRWNVHEARDFAVAAHGAQKYGEHPYSHHLDAVAGVLTAAGVKRAHVLCAAYLHDVVEDTKVSAAEIEQRFGPEVANIVSAVTKVKGYVLEQYLRGIANNPDAVLVKLADRIANTEASRANHPEMYAKYRQEYPVFRRILGMVTLTAEGHELWSRLEAAVDL